MYNSQSRHEFGPFRLDPARRLLFRENQPIPLPPKVLHTLLVLIENAGRVVTKDELMKAVWPDTFVEEGNLTQNISALRKVLGENPTEHVYIETIPKQGYRFIAAGLAEAQTPAMPWLTRQRGLILAGALSCLLVIAAGVRWYFGQRPAATNSLKITPLTSYPGRELPGWQPGGVRLGW